jgi:hypothetical protein
VLVAASDAKHLQPSPGPDHGTFQWGFLQGFVYRRAAFASGSLRLERENDQLHGEPIGVNIDPRFTECLGISQHKVGSLGCRICDFSAAVGAVYDYLGAVNDRNSTTLSAVASMQWTEFCALSKDLPLAGQYALDMLDAAYEELAPRVSPSKLGEIQGRICCETLACIIAERKLGSVSKERILSKLREANLLSAESPSLLDRVLSAWRALPFG